MYFCDVKIISLILALILLMSGPHPCMAKLYCQDSSFGKEETCHTAEEKHSCCMAKAENEQEEPAEESPCTKICSCYCCVMLIVFNLIEPNEPFQVVDNKKLNWQTTIYSHDFTHLIWQPPQLS